MTAEPYPLYSDTGIPWLPSLPEHWDLLRLKDALAALLSGGTPDSSNESYWTDNGDGIPWVAIGDMTKADVVKQTEKRLTSLGQTVKKIPVLPSGTLLYSIYASLGKVAVLGTPATTNQAILGIVPDAGKLDERFLMYWLKHFERYLGLFASSNTQQNLNAEKVRNFSVAKPLLEEQAQIAKFLDYETARIDALIDKQQQLIALLKEKRQAVISHAVTKGLNPDAPMRDSGVEWLGEIPANWEIRRLSHECDFQSGKAHEPFVDDDGEFICVNSRFVSTQGMKRKFCTRNVTPARVNDVLMVMSDLPNGRALARAFFVDDESPYAVNQRVCIVRARRANPKFLYYFLDRNEHFLRQDDGANQTHLSNSTFMKCPVLVPPPAEQLAIAEHLDQMARRMDDLVQNASAMVAVLEERRTALISAAVTGKIDVRGWKAPGAKAGAEIA